MMHTLSRTRIQTCLLLLLPLQLYSGTTEYTVTVGDKTGGGFAYKLNSIEAPSLTFALGETYKFNLDGITTAGHPFIFSTDAGGGGSTAGEFTTEVTNTQATSGFVQITVTVGMPSTLYYYCAAHGGMGGSITLVGTTDSDGDGMPDDWENDNGLDPSTDDASADPDGDRASNLLEFLSGGDPQLANTFAADSDSDGLSDALETANGLNSGAETTLDDALTALFDPDEDGLTSTLEDTLGLDPAVADTATSFGQAAIDPDGDGFTNDLENSLAGLDPENKNTHLELANLIVAPDTDEDGFSDALEISLDLDAATTTDNETFAKAVLDDDDDGIIVIGLDTSTSTLVQAFATEIIDPDGDGLTNAKEDQLDTDPDNATNLTEVAEALIDPDGDGFTSDLETANKLDATTATSLDTFLAALADKDEDGLLDSWEDASSIFSSASANTFVIDSDNDGLSDSLEEAQGSDPDAANLANEFAELLIDPDGDGLTTELEIIFGLDPTTQNLTSDLSGTDTGNDADNDGFTDNLELNLGLDPAIANTAEELANKTIDPDGDGFTTDLENQTDGLDPATANTVADLTGGSSSPTLPDGSSGASPVVDGWFYTSNMGWLFTNSTIFPYVYRKNVSNEGGGWLYFDTTSTDSLRFYNFGTGLWETH